MERTAPGAESFIYAGDVLHGTELAQRIIKHLVDGHAAERALVLQMPGWESRTPSSPAAVAVMRGNFFHILAVVDTWNVLTSPPPSLARFSKDHRWSYEGGDDVALGAALGELSKAWWAEAADEVGAVDVVGSITHALGTGLGTARGVFGNMVNGDPGKGDAERLVSAWVGRNGRSPRWPGLAGVSAGPLAISVTLTTATGGREASTLRTVNELAAALPAIVETLRATDDACAAWLVRLEALSNFTEVLREGLAGTWTTTAPFEIELQKEPTVELRATAAIGGNVYVLTTPLDRGLRVSVGKETIDIPDPTTIRSAIERVMHAVDVDACVLRASRLVEQQRYRVIRAFNGACVGDELIFREVTEVRPSGADVWFFAGVGAQRVSVSLSSDDAGDVAILDSLEDYLAP